MITAKEARAVIDVQSEGRFRRDLLGIEITIENNISNGYSSHSINKGSVNNIAKIKEKLISLGYSVSEDGYLLIIKW